MEGGLTASCMALNIGQRPYFYLMENREESIRLEHKTDPEAVRQQALYCGLRPGMRVLDAGCGPGKTSSILYEMVLPGGDVVGVDYSEKRIHYARINYEHHPGLEFRLHDLRDPLEERASFDLIWVRFVLEYNRKERMDIIRNLAECLKPGGILCLIDLDHNALNHYGLSRELEKTIFKLMDIVEKEYNFDPYVGRKLYASLYDSGFEDIDVTLMAHHLIYGEVKDSDLFNWYKKVEIASKRIGQIIDGYPGGPEGFFVDFTRFFNDPRRFTYTPLLICKGRKPLF
jgi:SAM-dependent methyltransferase